MSTLSIPPVTLARTADKNTDVLVVGYRNGSVVGAPDAVGKAFAKRYDASIGQMAERLGLSKDKALSSRTLPPAGGAGSKDPVLLVIGLGPDQDDLEGLRRAAGAAVRKAVTGGHDQPITIALALGVETAAQAGAVTEGALLGQYRYTTTNSRPAAPGVGRITVLTSSTQKPLATAVQNAQLVAAAVLQAREWINLPANLLYPESFAQQIRSYGRGAGLAVEVLDDVALDRGGYGGLLAVGNGSARKPRLVRLSYTPRGAKQHLVLVGKGITFDAGGLNLKPAEAMYTMKCDMSGAATVVAATRAVADLGLKIAITCYAALAENLPSDTAYRPSDVLTIYGGTTVENGNSDAEGRLVMADALARSAEDHPDLVIDVATLTGAVVTAVGDRTSGVFSNDDVLAEQVMAAARTTGESFWRLPIPEETRGRLDSKVADLRSTAADRPAGASVAAAFLREFVPSDTRWAHLDIAGSAFRTGEPYGYVVSGGTGVAVRTLVRLASDLAG